MIKREELKQILDLSRNCRTNKTDTVRLVTEVQFLMIENERLKLNESVMMQTIKTLQTKGNENE